MIWIDGRIMPDEELAVPAADRVFEHGIGLFETFRTWNGQARLLHRHLARMVRSAQTLGLPLNPRSLPEASDIHRLRDQSRIVEQDIVLRITMTGGSPGLGSARVWMRSSPVPECPSAGWQVTIVDSPVSPFDALSRHKTLNYWSRRMAYDRVTRDGFDEALFGMTTPSRRIAIEGSRTNLFIVKKGRLMTAGEDAPILPGVLRGLVLNIAENVGLPVEILNWKTIQTNPDLLDVDSADEVFLTNSVRGIVPVSRVDGRTFTAPGTMTRQLQTSVNDWLMGDDA